MVSYKIIGRNIKAARDRLGLTQEDVATKLELSVKYYGKMERGEVKQNLERLGQVSGILSVPLETLVAGALPFQEYSNRMPQDDVGAKVALLIGGCDSAHRAAILAVCKTIATLDKE